MRLSLPVWPGLLGLLLIPWSWTSFADRPPLVQPARQPAPTAGLTFDLPREQMASFVIEVYHGGRQCEEVVDHPPAPKDRLLVRFNKLPLGPKQVLLFDPPHPPRVIKLALDGDRTVRLWDRAVANITVKGQVTDATGAPLDGVRVSAAAAGPAVPPGLSALRGRTFQAQMRTVQVKLVDRQGGVLLLPMATIWTGCDWLVGRDGSLTVRTLSQFGGKFEIQAPRGSWSGQPFLFHYRGKSFRRFVDAAGGSRISLPIVASMLLRDDLALAGRAPELLERIDRPEASRMIRGWLGRLVEGTRDQAQSEAIRGLLAEASALLDKRTALRPEVRLDRMTALLARALGIWARSRIGRVR